MKNLRLAFLLVASFFTLWGCGSSIVHDPQLRVVHLSPDAPPVDVSIAGNVALEDVSYRQASKFLSQQPGNTSLQILAANTSTAVIDTSLNLLDDTKYTVMAINNVANIEPLVIIDDNQKPASGYAALRVVHGAPSAPAVDVYVSAPSDDFSTLSPLLEDVPFKAIANEIEVASGDYRVRVTLANNHEVIYDSGTIALESGVEYIAVASDVDAGPSPIGLTILTDDSSTPVAIADDARARVRVVHASADAPEVDVSVDGTDVLSMVPFAVGSDYLKLLEGTYNIDVAASANSMSVINADLMFDARMDYTIAAVNNLNNIEPLVLVDDNTPPASNNVKVRLIHAAPSAGLVDIYINAPNVDISTLNPTIKDFNFKDNSGYLEVPAGDYRVRVTLATTKTVAIDTGTLSLSSGQIRTAFALDPAPGSSKFGVLLLNDLN